MGIQKDEDIIRGISEYEGDYVTLDKDRLVLFAVKMLDLLLLGVPHFRNKACEVKQPMRFKDLTFFVLLKEFAISSLVFK